MHSLRWSCLVLQSQQRTLSLKPHTQQTLSLQPYPQRTLSLWPHPQCTIQQRSQ